MDAMTTGFDKVRVEAPATPELDAVRLRRAELRESLGQLEQALAASTLAESWGARVHQALSQLARDFDDHIRVTEGPDGLHETILAGDLRLANQVAALVGEHKTIAAEIAELASRVDPAAAMPIAPGDVAGLREHGTTVLGRIVRHRQRGADLVYEAYATDIGGGD
jgi:hypothetical protein